MAWRPITTIPTQYLTTSSVLASGYVLKAYSAGTATTIAFATDSTGATQAATVTLNADGYPEVSGNIIIPHINETYKLSLYPTQAAADSNTGAAWTLDNLYAVFTDKQFVEDRYGVAHSVAASALTLALKNSLGNDPSDTGLVRLHFPSSTASSGTPQSREVTAALSVTVPSGATLGHNSALKQYIYLYAIDNAGTVELAVSFKYFGQRGIASTTALAATSDTGTTMYSTTARTSIPFVCLAYCEITEATAGAWDTEPSTVHLAPFTLPVISFSATKTANQTAVATGIKSAFGTETYDNGSLFDSATNFRWVPPPGAVTISAGLLYTGTLVDQEYYACSVFKNGSVYKKSQLHASGVAEQIAPSITIKDQCNGADYYEVFVVHSAAGAPDVASDPGSFFMGSWSPGRS